MGYEIASAQTTANPLLRALHHERNAVRAAAAASLGCFKNGPRVVEALLSLLDDTHAPVQLASIYALGELDDERAGAAFQTLRQGDNHRLRAAAKGRLS